MSLWRFHNATIVAALVVFTACSDTPNLSDASVSEIPDAGAEDASTNDAMPSPDAGPLETCLPPQGPPPTLGPQNDLAHLNGPLVPGQVSKFAITPNSKTVVFIADTENLGMMRLYAAPIGGGPITRLSHNDQILPGQDVLDFAITSSGDRVVFRGDVDEENFVRLYSVPIAGGVVETLTPTYQTSRFRISPDDAWVLIVEYTGAPFFGVRLHSVPTVGGASNLLSHPLSDFSSDIRSFQVTPDGSRVVFLGDTEVEDAEQIYSVPIAGGTIVEVSQSTDADTTKYLGGDFAVTADSTTAVYSGTLEGDSRHRLYRAPIEGGTSDVLVDEVDSLALGDAYDPEVVGSDRIFFRGRFVDSSAGQYFSVSLVDGSTALLTPNLATHGQNTWKNVSPDGQYAVFPATSPEGVKRAYAVPVAGGPLRTLSQNVFEVPEHAVYSTRVTEDSRRVVYYGNADPDGVERFYAVCIEGGAPLTLSPNVGPDKDMRPSSGNVEISEDGRFAAFKGTLLAPEVEQLFVADMTTHTILTVDSNISDPALGIRGFAISPDSSWVVFTGDQLLDGVTRLYTREIRQD